MLVFFISSLSAALHQKNTIVARWQGRHDQDNHAHERVQALADISRSLLCRHSNETRAPIANPPNSAQLGGTLTNPQVTSGSVQYCGNAARNRQTDRQTSVTDTHFASATPHAKGN